MRFIANLRRETVDAFTAAQITPAGYLLSAHRITPAALHEAHRVRRLGLPLFADNGTVELIDRVVERHRADAEAITAEVGEIRHRLGRVPRGRDVPSELRARAADLAEQVLASCSTESEAQSADELLSAQLSMDPTDVIAQEDFATACLLSLGLERETTGWSVQKFVVLNERTLRLWRRVSADRRTEGLRVYAVLSAMDYNTARAAGRLASAAGVRDIAFGVASITRDPKATDFFVMGSGTVSLDRPVPRRYVRLAQIVRGLQDGATENGNPFEHVHCLGLGAAALLPVPAIGFDAHSALSTDSTSPIHDAAKDRIFYNPLERGDRSSTVEIVRHIVTGGDWPFVSPFTIAFRKQFGHDPGRAIRWWTEQGQPEVTVEMLSTSSELTEALPLFAEVDPVVSRIARDTRIAHNHWVLGEIASKRSGPDRRAIALAILDEWLAGPATVTTRALAVARSILLR